jgi:type IV pilus assembly protein PilC
MPVASTRDALLIEAATTSDPQPTSEQAMRGRRHTSLRRLASLEITHQRIRRQDLMHFSRQLSVFVKAGIPILEALEAIREEMGNKRLKQILGQMADDLSAGSTLSGAAEKHPDAFPDYFLGIIRSAELTGNLDTALERLSEYIERDMDARNKVTSALLYPSVVVGLAVVVVVVLSTYVLPKFETFFKTLHAKLPLATRIMIDATRFITGWWYVIIAGIAAVLLGSFLAMRTKRGLAIRDSLVLRIPAIGEVVRYALLERFCRILSGMVTSGVPIPDALVVTTASVHNAVFQSGLSQARTEMMRGEGLARPLARTGLFPAAARQMFTVGESTGTLDDQLQTAAIFLDRELDYKIKRLTTLFEPVVLIFVGVIVGFVAIALVSAMYGVFRQVNIHA